MMDPSEKTDPDGQVEDTSAQPPSWAEWAYRRSEQPVTPPANPTIDLLRIIVWLIPAFCIPLWAYVFAFTNSRLFRIPNPLLFYILCMIVSVVFLGYIDKRLSLMKNQVPPPYKTSDLFEAILSFVFMQIIVTPLVLITLMMGSCIVFSLIP